MKKHIAHILSAALLLMSLTGCKQTILEFPEGEGIDPTLVEVDLSLSVDNAPFTLYAPELTKSKATPAADTCQVRWIIGIYRDDAGSQPVEQHVFITDKAADGRHHISTPLSLHAAKYHVVAWMDYVDRGSDSSKYYSVPSLTSIKVPEQGRYIGDDDHKDAFSISTPLDLTEYSDSWFGQTSFTDTLHRPMAKIEFITTDIEKFLYNLSQRGEQGKADVAENLLGKNPDLSTISVEVVYSGYFPSGFNARIGEPNDAMNPGTMSFKTNMQPLDEHEAHLAADYVFVNGQESAVFVNLILRDSEGNILNTAEGIEVPIERGKHTIIRDDFLTRSYTPGIGIDPGFDGEITIVIPD